MYFLTEELQEASPKYYKHSEDSQLIGGNPDMCYPRLYNVRVV